MDFLVYGNVFISAFVSASFPIAMGLAGLFVEMVTVEECRKDIFKGYTLQLYFIIVTSLMMNIAFYHIVLSKGGSVTSRSISLILFLLLLV